MTATNGGPTGTRQDTVAAVVRPWRPVHPDLDTAPKEINGRLNRCAALLLKALSERGLVERRGDTRDRRVAHVRLTDAGRDLVDGILPEQLAYETAVLSDLDPHGQEELASLLGDLLTRLEGRLGSQRA